MRRFSLLVLLVIFVCAGCTPAQGEVKPPEILYGEDICEICGMIISEARFASACVTTDGQEHIFDGIGEMLVFYHDQEQDTILQCFVHDYVTEGWLVAEEATFVLSDNIHTPMGFGIVAVGTRESADTLALESGGKTHTWAQLLARDG